MNGRLTPVGDFEIELWMFILSHGEHGVKATDVHAAYAPMSTARISAGLATLRRKLHVDFTGSNRHGRWLISRSCNPPESHSMPAWAVERAEPPSPALDWADHQAEGDDDAPLGCKPAGTTMVVMPKAPASVFNVAVDADGASATPDVPAPCYAVGARPLEARAQVVQTVNAFRCSIDSDGCFSMAVDGQLVVLSVDRTRTMLRYLDHVLAVDDQDLVSSITGVAS